LFDDQNNLIGVFKEVDAVNRDKFTPLASVANKDIVSVPFNLSPEKMFDILSAQHVTVAACLKKIRK